jgi:hypothetical protein
MEHYEANPSHHFCNSMMHLPYLLDNLVQSDQFTSIPVAEFIERIWNSIIDWHCPREKEEGTQSSSSNQCDCYQKRDQILGQLIGTMARIDQNHARKMLATLPNSPGKVHAVERIAAAGQVDKVLIEESKETILATFQKPLQRAQAYYQLAAVLPIEMTDSARKLFLEAEPWLDTRYISSGIVIYPPGGSPDDLITSKARTLIRLIQYPPSQEQIDEILSIARSLGAFSNKHAIFRTLFQQAENWPVKTRVNVLRRVLKAAINDGLTGIQAVIAAAVPVVHSLEGNWERLLERVEWAYQ